MAGSRQFAGCSHAVCTGCPRIFVAPGCRSVTVLSTASWDSVMLSWVRLQLWLPHIPQKSNQQQVFWGTPVALMSAGMSWPASLRTWESGVCGVCFCTVMCSWNRGCGTCIFAVDFGSVFASCAPGHHCMLAFACPWGHLVGAAVVGAVLVEWQSWCSL